MSAKTWRHFAMSAHVGDTSATCRAKLIINNWAWLRIIFSLTDTPTNHQLAHCFVASFDRVPSVSIFSSCGGRMPSTQHISASPMVSGSRRCAGSRAYVHQSLRYGPRGATPCLSCSVAEVPSKNVTSRLKKCYSVYESVWDGSNIFARRVTVGVTKYHQKWVQIPPWCEPLLRIPTLRWVLRHHLCYFSNVSAISRK